MKKQILIKKQVLILQAVLIIFVGSLMCVIFTAFNPPVFTITDVRGMMEWLKISPQRAEYWWRFMLSLLCMGVVPFAVGKFMGLSMRNMGISSGKSFITQPLFLIALPVAFLIGAIGAASPDLSSYYPYATDLTEIVRQNGLIHLAGHLAAYFFLYYLPWEFFFRGFMLFPFVLVAEDLRSTVPRDSSAHQGATMMLACAVLFQTIPSTMLHFGHPLSEMISAIPAGMVFGYIAYKAKSIVPPLLLHACVGFGTDTFIILRALRVS